MTLSTTLTIYLGVLIECLWLWDAAREKHDHADRTWTKGRRLSTPTRTMGIAAVVGIILIGAAELVGENPVTAYIDNALQFLLMGATMFFLLIAGAVGGWLLPRVNEYNIVSVLATVALNALAQGRLDDPILVGLFIGVPAILVLTLVLERSSPTLTSKVMLYLLYLGALIFLTIQTGVIEAAGQSHFTIPEAFVFGTTFTFLSLHTLFGLRFFVITASLVLPANRVYTRPMMTKLFRDDQIAPLSFLLALAGILTAVFLNHRLALFPADTFAGAVVILCTQLLFRNERGTPHI